MMLVITRQWPKVHDFKLCHTFFCTMHESKNTLTPGHVRIACVPKKNQDMRVSCEKLPRITVRAFFYSHNVQKRATKSDTSGHCLELTSGAFSFLSS